MAFLDETGLAELWSLIKGEDAEFLASALSADVKIGTGSYTGTGTYGTIQPYWKFGISARIGFTF